MKGAKILLGLALAAVIGLVFVLPACAQDKGSQTSGSIQAGGETMTGQTDSAKLQQYQVIPKGFVVFGADFNWDSSNNYYLNFKGSDFGYDDQRATLVWGKKSTWRLNLSWDQIPNWRSNTGRTLFDQPELGVFTAPYAMRAFLQANPNNLADYVPGALPVDLRTIRETAGAAFRYFGIEHWTFNVKFQDEYRHGDQALSLVSGSQVTEFAAPIRYRTQNWGASAEYADGKWFGSAAFNASRFRDNVSEIYADNPMRVDDGTGSGLTAAHFRAGVPPDNSAWSVDLAGGVNLPYHHRFTGALSWGQMNQDSTLLPYTTNTAINALPTFNPVLPYTSVHAKMDTFLGNLRFTGDPFRWLGYSAFYRIYDMDNKTPYYVFPNYATGDASAHIGDVGTWAVGIKRNSWGTEVHFTPWPVLRLGLAYNKDKWDHQWRDSTDNDQEAWKFTLDLNWKWVSFRGSYTDLKYREGGENEAYEDVRYPGTEPGEDPGATQFDISNRNSKIYNLVLILTPWDKFAFTVSTQENKNEYPDSIYGLTFNRYTNWNLDATYAFNDRFSCYASYVHEKLKNEMASQTRTTVNGVPVYDWKNDWWNNTDETIHTYTIGVRFSAGKCFDLTSDLAYSNGESKSNMVYTGLGVDQASGKFNGHQYFGYPNVFSKLTIWKTRFNYHFNKALSASLEYWWQRLESADWARDPMQVYMAASDPAANKSLYLGARIPGYDANIFRLFLDYKF